MILKNAWIYRGDGKGDKSTLLRLKIISKSPTHPNFGSATVFKPLKTKRHPRSLVTSKNVH